MLLASVVGLTLGSAWAASADEQHADVSKAQFQCDDSLNCFAKVQPYGNFSIDLPSAEALPMVVKSQSLAQSTFHPNRVFKEMSSVQAMQLNGTLCETLGYEEVDGLHGFHFLCKTPSGLVEVLYTQMSVTQKMTSSKQITVTEEGALYVGNQEIADLTSTGDYDKIDDIRANAWTNAIRYRKSPREHRRAFYDFCLKTKRDRATCTIWAADDTQYQTDRERFYKH